CGMTLSGPRLSARSAASFGSSPRRSQYVRPSRRREGQGPPRAWPFGRLAFTVAADRTGDVGAGRPRGRRGCAAGITGSFGPRSKGDVPGGVPAGGGLLSGVPAGGALLIAPGAAPEAQHGQRVLPQRRATRPAGVLLGLHHG